MPLSQLKSARQAAGWTQHKAAVRLGVSQPYYSQLENGSRPMPLDLTLAAVRRLRLSPVVLPLAALAPRLSPVPEDQAAAVLAWLGYPGFAHLRKSVRPLNPAELVARALAHEDLDPRVLEGLAWVLAAFYDLDWKWLGAQCRLLNRQNQLGFLVTLSAQLGNPGAEHLRAMLPDRKSVV